MHECIQSIDLGVGGHGEEGSDMIHNSNVQERNYENIEEKESIEVIGMIWKDSGILDTKLPSSF